MTNTLAKRHARRNKIILLTNQLEWEYKSISNVPEDNPKLQELQRLAMTNGRDEETKKRAVIGKKNKARLSPEKASVAKKQAIELAKKGKINKEIALDLNVPMSTISTWLSQYRKSIKPKVYNYRVENIKTKECLYVHSKSEIKQWALENNISFYFLNQGLNPTYKVIRERVFWTDLPYGAIYIISWKEKYFRKTGIKSFGLYKFENFSF